MSRLRVLLLTALAVSLCASPGRAQLVDDQATDPPAHVAFVDGAAVLERDGRPDAAPLNMPLLAGDRLRTQTGRVEIIFGDGSLLHIDARTVVDFQSDELVRLLEGRVRLTVPGANRAISYRIDAPWASAQITQSGEYRLSMLAGDRGSEIELAVIRGAAELVNDQGRTPLRAGERALARPNVAPSYAYVYNSAEWDAFDQWSEARRDERLGVSTQYLPDDVRPYAASFDQYGSWQYEASYGHVWYPRVAVGWRPYYNGHWATVRPYGWTWIGADPWAWPTHHYGRWGFSAGLWFWIPGHTWGPAWVSWAYAPGYVSWCPLGWNNYAVIQIGAGYRHGYDPWRAWTVVPAHHFHGGYVNVRSVGRFDLDSHTRTAFSVGTRGPAYGGYAVPRASAPIRAAGSGRRSTTSPLYTNLDARDSRVGSAPSRTIVGRSPEAAGAGRAQRSPGYGGAPDTRAPAVLPRAAQAAVAGAPDTARVPGSRPAPAYQDPGGYGRIDRAPSRSAVPRDDRVYGTPSAQPVRRGSDMGIGGNSASPGTGAPAPMPAYGRRAPDRSDSPAVTGSGVGRAMPRGRDESPAYRSSPPERRGAEPAPSRPAAAAPRGPDRSPSADRHGSPTSARPSGGGPTGQARPRGGRGN